MEDVLKSVEFVADAEIFVETLPGCYKALIERNRTDETKKNIYPLNGVVIYVQKPWQSNDTK